MKGTISKNGKIRANISLNYRIGLDEIVDLWLCEIKDTEPAQIQALAETETKKEIMEAVKRSIRYRGIIQPAYTVSDEFDAKVVETVARVFTKRFKELSPTPAQLKAIEKFNLMETK